MCLEIIYLMYMYEKNFALNNLQGLICHKTKPNQKSSLLVCNFASLSLEIRVQLFSFSFRFSSFCCFLFNFVLALLQLLIAVTNFTLLFLMYFSSPCIYKETQSSM